MILCKLWIHWWLKCRMKLVHFFEFHPSCVVLWRLNRTFESHKFWSWLRFCKYRWKCIFGIWLTMCTFNLQCTLLQCKNGKFRQWYCFWQCISRHWLVNPVIIKKNYAKTSEIKSITWQKDLSGKRNVRSGSFSEVFYSGFQHSDRWEGPSTVACIREVLIFSRTQIGHTIDAVPRKVIWVVFERFLLYSRL